MVPWREGRVEVVDGGRNAAAVRSLRVLIVIENMSYTYDTRMRKVARALDAAGHTVRVICPRLPGDPAAARDGRIAVSFFPAPPSGRALLGHAAEYAYSFTAVALLSTWHLLRDGFDVIHICNPPDLFFPLGRLYRLLGKRFVFDLHDLCPELTQIRYARWPLVHRFALALERWTVRAADHVLVTSATARDRVLCRGGIARDCVTLVQNGPDLAAMPAVRRYGGRRGVVEVGYVGDMNPQDGLDTLLGAARHIAVTLGRRDVRFVCIGDGSSYPALRRTAERLGLGDSVTFTGRLPPDAAMKRLAACALCVLPDPKNPFTDSCVMVKSLEYMALGKAFAAFDLAETRAVCADAALYAEGNDPAALAAAILALVDDPERRRRLGRIGRRRIEEGLAWPLCAAALLQAYDVVARTLPAAAGYTVREA